MGLAEPGQVQPKWELWFWTRPRHGWRMGTLAKLTRPWAISSSRVRLVDSLDHICDAEESGEEACTSTEYRQAKAHGRTPKCFVWAITEAPPVARVDV